MQQWQTAFFEVYPDILKSAAVLPTIGNHEMGVRSAADMRHQAGVLRGKSAQAAEPRDPRVRSLRRGEHLVRSG
jgi:hypothetical protein